MSPQPALARQRRVLGRTGLAVSPVGLGCSGFWGHRRFPEASAAAVVAHALAHGVNLLDTGHNYSGFHAEPRLGRILRPLLKHYPRDALVISSKGGTLTGQAGISGAEQRNFSPAAITASCEASLRNLGLDHLDIYQLHGASEHDINDDLLAALQRLRERGLIRHTGINTHSASTLRWMIAHPTAFDVVLLDYNALQQDREPLIDQLHAAGIGVLAGTVLAQGHLLPARRRLPRLADGWYLARAWLKPSSRQLMYSARSMRSAVAAINSQRPAQTAFAYALGHPGVASGILGTTRIGSLDEVLATRPEALSAAERQQLVDAFGDGRGSPSH
ncbi:MAG: aldo/keto reductase [Stenotrophomonas sp.]|jgi:aryl-alcohol dehydrogenase-like predicted oxidoreductase|uniref:aldo/keto reductase n=1 Tax=Stenotrophomonas sp. TaxID=69392 RepID=UPI00283D0025|nr:aldo/keto reductase [Stenotrophomonas sp.]MDR2960397.1 aldo/keto reductase [Stenotrophomonas sp.]